MSTLQKVKDYWNARPCNIRHSTKEMGSREYFEEVEARKYKVEPHIPKFVNFPRWKGKNILEIGCGIGTDTENFLRNNVKFYAGIDLSAASISITNQRISQLITDSTIFLKEGNAEKLTELITEEFPSFDLIYSFGVLHHTPNYMKAFEEVTKVMKPHTEFKLMVYNKGAFKVHQILEDYDFDYEYASELIAKHSEAQSGCPVTYTFTPKSITADLEAAGMEVISIEIDHIFPYKVDKYKNYEYEREDIWQMPEETFKAFEKRYGWHLLITAKLKQ